jgi:ribosomal 30S subunit maturation factor RimM
MIPFVDEYIENIDNKNKCIYVKNVGGLVKWR